ATDDGVRATHRIAPREHNRLLLPTIDALLAAAGLGPDAVTGVLYGRGPGSFTGLRMAVAAAQALAWANDAPVLGVSTLEVLAATALAEAGAGAPPHVLVVCDARMGEVYANLFAVEEGGLRAVHEDAVRAPEGVPALAAGCGDLLVVGDGVPLVESGPWPPGVGLSLRPEVLPHARWLLALGAPRLRAGEGGPAATAAPVYLRDERRWRRLGEPAAR
ncbi:MAG: tRNA (adenosine(37)-N6)-threonylcarbamoyltransferase complex dimerization subunit type 1 TsaB, partial [Pseudomonadales bacterium]|nr:tRNA (adenosine(37)-N6)-threonylcarbamoyltransferase complex dimerization subunit type 1 TsaB [Pseudomonadales bacterium]